MSSTVTAYPVVIEKSDNGYAAYLPDLPGCVAAGDTEEETKALIAEAVAEHLTILADNGLPIPDPIEAVPVQTAIGPYCAQPLWRCGLHRSH